MIFFYKKNTEELIALRKGSFSKCENTKSILLLGSSPPVPPKGPLPLYHAGGLGHPQTPHLWGVSLTPSAIYFLFISIYLKTFSQPCLWIVLFNLQIKFTIPINYTSSTLELILYMGAKVFTPVN